MMMAMTMTMLLGMDQALSSSLLDQKVNIDGCFSGLLLGIASFMALLLFFFWGFSFGVLGAIGCWVFLIYWVLQVIGYFDISGTVGCGTIPHIYIDLFNPGTAPTARHGVVNMKNKLIYESMMTSKSKHLLLLIS